MKVEAHLLPEQHSLLLNSGPCGRVELILQVSQHFLFIGNEIHCMIHKGDWDFIYMSGRRISLFVRLVISAGLLIVVHSHTVKIASAAN